MNVGFWRYLVFCFWQGAGGSIAFRRGVCFTLMALAAQSARILPGDMSHCGHDHQNLTDGRRLVAAFCVIAVFMVVEAIGGVISGSLALLADATHMLTDALALALAASAQWLASRPADRRLHFGYRRTQVLAAFVNGIALAILLAGIFVEAVRRFFFAPIDVNWSLMLGVAILGLIANGVAFVILHRSSSGNLNVRGAMLHVISDLLGSVAAIIGAVTIAATGWTRIDPILSIIVAFLIGRSAWRLIRETGHVLMEGAPNHIDVEKLVVDLRRAAPEVADIHQVQIWQITPDEIRLTMHARIRSPQQVESALQRMKAFLETNYGIEQSTVQVETSDECPDCRTDDDRSDVLHLDPKISGRAPVMTDPGPRLAGAVK